jgi:hypothetical protein
LSLPEVTSKAFASSPEDQAVYCSGEVVPAAGTYWVRHAKHRAAHAAKIRFLVFPSCSQCGESVRFQPAQGSKPPLADWLRRDPDFKEALKSERKRIRKRSSQQ